MRGVFSAPCPSQVGRRASPPSRGWADPWSSCHNKTKDTLLQLFRTFLLLLGLPCLLCPEYSINIYYILLIFILFYFISLIKQWVQQRFGSYCPAICSTGRQEACSEWCVHSMVAITGTPVRRLQTRAQYGRHTAMKMVLIALIAHVCDCTVHIRGGTAHDGLPHSLLKLIEVYAPKWEEIGGEGREEEQTNWVPVTATFRLVPSLK